MGEAELVNIAKNNEKQFLNKNKMKKSITILATIVSALSMFTSCETSSNEETAAQEKMNNNSASANETIILKEETLCFISKNVDGGSNFLIQLSIKGDSIRGTSDETVEWTGEKTTFVGIRKNDSLLIKSTFRDGPDGDFVTENNTYLLQSEKLFGKKDPKSSQFSLLFDKIDCK